LALDLAGHLFLLLDELLTLLNALDLSFLDLVDNDEGTLASGFLADNFTLFLHLK